MRNFCKILFSVMLFFLASNLFSQTITLHVPDSDNGMATLSWNACYPGTAAHYHIYRKIDANNLTEIDTLHSADTTIVWTDPRFFCSKTQLTYRIQVLNNPTMIWSDSVVAVVQNVGKPQPTNITSISVNPTTGKMELFWIPSPEENVTHYIIYKDDGNITIPEFDTIYGKETNHYEFAIPPSDESGYRISPVDGCGNFALHEDRKRIFTMTSSYDVCSKKITVNWTAGDSAVNNVSRYNIFVSKDGSNFTSVGMALPTDRTKTFATPYPDSNVVYCYIQANTADTNVSSSCQVDTIIQEHIKIPDYLHLDNISVTSPSTIELKYSVDNATPFGNLLIREDGNVVKTLPYNQIDNNPLTLPYSSKEFSLAVTDTCDKIVLESNSSQTILLEIQKIENIVYLSWSEYFSWDGGVLYYEVYRKVDADTQLIAMIPANASITNYADDISMVNGAAMYYYVIAYENKGYAYYGLTESSKSNTVSIFKTEIVQVFFPTGFYPASNIPENQFYKPIYAKAEGDIVEWHIYNNMGQVVYSASTADAQGWDGKVLGKNAQAGSYVYVFILTRNHKESVYKGSFSLLR